MVHDDNIQYLHCFSPELLSTAVSMANPKLLRAALTYARPDLLEEALTKSDPDLLATALQARNPQKKNIYFRFHLISSGK